MLPQIENIDASLWHPGVQPHSTKPELRLYTGSALDMITIGQPFRKSIIIIMIAEHHKYAKGAASKMVPENLHIFEMRLR